MSRLFLWVSVAFIFIAEPTCMSAQSPVYDSAALRMEGRFGDIQIVRGAEGTILGKIGIFRGIDVAQLVASSEPATVEARQFARDYRPGTLLVALGLATLGAYYGVSQIHDVNRLITTGLVIAGTGSLVYGGGRLQNAYNALARSLWWYNRDLRH